MDSLHHAALYRANGNTHILSSNFTLGSEALFDSLY